MSRVHLASLAEDLRSNTIDLRTFLRHLTARSDDIDSLIHALLPEVDRYQRLTNDADRLEERYPVPVDRPSLFGVPFGVKDIMRVDGFETRAGSRLPPELFAGDEASSVTALRAAGGLVFGKTVTTEFAVFQPGPTRNPYALDHTPGGSSSGSAAGVAAGLFPLALGTQTIGSIIRPAAYCGVVGVKPSAGRVPGEGVVPCSPSLDTVGFFTQDITGARLAARSLYRDWNDRQQSQTGLPVLGVPAGPFLEQASSEGLAAFDTQIDQLRSVGYDVHRVPALPNIADIDRRHRALMFGEMARIHAGWFERYEHLYGPQTVDLIRFGQCIDELTIEKGREGRGLLRTEIEELMSHEGVDLWISPSATGPAPQGIESTGDPAMNLPWTHAGLPTITLPAGTINGLPIGLQVTARFDTDERLLLWAEDLSVALSRYD